MNLGPYELLAEVGRGGMGAVYRGRGPDGSPVAVKVLLDLDAAGRARFEREKRLLGALGGAEGFVPLLDAGETERGPYLVMPFLEGGSLKDRLRRGPLGIEQTVELGRALARALSRAHERGIVHRDLTPGNVLFDGERPLVADLGLAKQRRRDGGSMSGSLSTHGALGGTVGYMAPEQVDDVRAATPAADVFSVGAILYECLAGVPPFGKGTLLTTLEKLNKGAVEPVQKLRPETPKWLAAVVERALQRDPKSRFADGRELGLALAGPKGGVGSSRGLLVAALLAVLGLGAIGTGVLVRLRKRPPPVSPAPPVVPSPRPSPAVPSRPAPSPPPPPPRLPDDPTALEQYRAMIDLGAARLVSVWGDPAFKGASAVTAIAVTRDGKLAVSGGNDPLIMVWSVPRGALVRTFTSPCPARALAITENGERFVVAGTDKILRVRDMASGLVLRDGVQLDAMISSIDLAPAPDERALVACDDGTIRLLDLATGAKLPSVGAPATKYTVAAARWDARIAAAGCQDGSVRVVSFDGGKERWSAPGHGALVTDICFSPDGKHIATASADRTAAIWELGPAGLTQSRVLAGHRGGVIRARFSPDGSRLVTSSDDMTLKVWDAGGTEQRTLTGHLGWVAPIAFVPGGSRLVSGGSDTTVRLWDVATGEELTNHKAHIGPIRDVAFTPDGEQAVTGGDDGILRLWSARSGELRAADHRRGGIAAAAIAPDKRMAFAARRPTGVDRLEVTADGVLNFVETSPTSELVTSLVVSPDGRFALLGGEKGRLRLANLFGGSEGWDAGVDPPVTSVAFSRDSLHPRSADGAGTLREWTLEKVAPRQLALEAGASWSLTPDARRALSIGDALKVWDMATGAARVLAAGREFLSGAISADGARAVTVERTGAVRVWDTDAGAELFQIELLRAPDAASRIAFAPTGRRFALATARGLVLLLELD